jgi:hypothetical protein
MTEPPSGGPLLRPDQRLVFVGGLHRSGTSLLARLLSAHPDASGLTGTNVPEDEGQHVQDVYPVGTEHGGPGRFANSPEAHLTESSPLATPENARRLIESWAPYWDMSRTYLVEKTPPNLLMSRFLQELFPHACFVFIVRHPVPVSLASRKWRKKLPFGRLMNHWFTAHDTARGDLPHLRRVQVLKYEELMARPDQTLADVARFVGMSSGLDGSEINPSRTDTYAQQWAGLLASGDEVATRMVRRFGDRAQEYGYDLTDLTAVSPFPGW